MLDCPADRKRDRLPAYSICMKNWNVWKGVALKSCFEKLKFCANWLAISLHKIFKFLAWSFQKIKTFRAWFNLLRKIFFREPICGCEITWNISKVHCLKSLFEKTSCKPIRFMKKVKTFRRLNSLLKETRSFSERFASWNNYIFVTWFPLWHNWKHFIGWITCWKKISDVLNEISWTISKVKSGLSFLRNN